MQGTKGVREVLAAWSADEPLRRGNARTDGHSCFLFDNEIVRDSPPECMLAEARIFNYSAKAAWFTFAGWPSQSTLRHIRVYIPWAERDLLLQRGKILFSAAPGGIGGYLELDANEWYCFERIMRLEQAKKESANACV